MKNVFKGLEKIGAAKVWFWPLLVAAVALAFFIIIYLAANFISPANQGSSYLIERIVKSGAVLGVTWVISRLYSIIGNHIYKSQFNSSMPMFMHSLFNCALLALAALFIVIYILKQPLWSVIAAAGLIGAAVAYGVQNLVVDIFSGLVLNIENNFKVNDWLKISDDVIGQVVKSSWRSLTILTNENVLIIVPNGKLTTNGFQNLSRPYDKYYDYIDVAVDHDIPVARTERILHTALLSIPEFSQDKNLEAYAKNTDEGGITYRLRYPVSDYARNRYLRHKIIEACSTYLQMAGLKLSETLGEYSLSKASLELILREELTAQDVINKIDLFKPLNEEEINQLCKRMNRLLIKKDSEVIKQGEEGSSMFIIAEGRVDVIHETYINNEFTQTVLTQLGPYEFFGDIALLLGEKRSSTVKSRTNLILFEAPKEALAPILKNRPEIAEKLSEIVANRQQETARLKSLHHSQALPHSLTAQQILNGIKSFFGI